MIDTYDLIKNIHKVKTTDLGLIRIKRNLNLKDVDVVEYCKDQILSDSAFIIGKGKNYYITVGDESFTVNRSSYTIITAHKS